MRDRFRRASGFALVMMGLLGGCLEARADTAADGERVARIAEAYARRPLAFEANRGQTDTRVRFLARGERYTSFFTGSEAVLALTGRDGARRALRLSWPGSRPASSIAGEEPLPTPSHYMIGHEPTRWVRDVPSYARIRYEEIHPGVDLVFYGRQAGMEYDLILAPGVDAGMLRFALEGADHLFLEATGDLVARLGGDEVRFKRPVSYQEVEGVRREVASRYRMQAGSEVGFEVGPYDPTRPLVIDPVIVESFVFEESDRGVEISVDAAGNAYVMGLARSADFPLVNGGWPGQVSEFLLHPYVADAFVTMFDPLGRIVYSTYLGSEYVDEPIAMELSPITGVVVSGYSWSYEHMQAWVAQVSPGGPIQWITLGPPERSVATGVAVDRLGQIYVSGYSTYNYDDAWVAKLSPAGEILYFTEFGGEVSSDEAHGIALDSAGNAWVTGFTLCFDFPLLNPVQDTIRGLDAFLVRIDPAGTVTYSTVLGGSLSDAGQEVTVGPDGTVFVAGSTQSADFPIVEALQPGYGGGSDMFVARFSPAGALLSSTYLGGTGNDQLRGLEVGRSGLVYLAGTASSTDSPLRDPGNPGCSGALFGLLDARARTILQTACLPGAVVQGIAVDSQGFLYATGDQSSSAFVAKLAFNRPPECGAAAASPASIWPPNGKLVPVIIRGVTDPESDQVTISITGITQDEPLTRAGTPDAAGIGTATARVRADRAGHGDGRIYRLGFEARDPQGATCTGTVTVCVPHSQRPGATCGDGGVVADSARP